MIFETRIPLITRDSDEILHVMPVPQSLDDKESVHILSISEYLAINLKKDALLSVTENDLKTCLKQDADTILCSLKAPVYHINDDAIMCRKDRITKQCQVIREPCEPQWTELQQVNTYFYFCCKPCQLKLLCDDNISSLTLSSAGLITISPGCVIKFKDYTIHTHQHGKNELYLKTDLLTTILAPINNIINISVDSIM